jgi:hypothetical protein
MRWRIPVHSNVCKLKNLVRSREVREGGSNAKPSLGNDPTPLHGPVMERRVSMSIEVRDGFLSNISQFVIYSDLKLRGIPLSGNVSISGQSYIVTVSNFGRRVLT